MRSWMLAVILAVIAIAPVAILMYHYSCKNASSEPLEQPIAAVQFEAETPKILEAGSKYDVKACKVLDGYRFELYLEDGKWIEAHLKVAAKDEAGAVVVEWMNKATPPPPCVTLLRHVGDHWIVEFELTVDGKRADMVDLLRAKGLLL